MTVCFFGHYNPHYSRNRVLKKGLIENGVKVIECNDFGLWLLLKYFRFGRSADVIFVAFPGNEDMPLAWILGKIFGKTVVFDAFISRFDTKVFDRKEFGERSLRAKLAFFLDWQASFLADIVLLDTKCHIKYFVKTFKLPLSKFRRVFVGTDEDIFFPRKVKTSTNKIVVGFHGYYIPLQGAQYIIEAAYLLRSEKSVQFRMLGEGPDFEKCLHLAQNKKLDNIEFLKPVPYESLPDFIAQTDVYLGGPFGESGKAQRVIPNKVFEALAMKKPVIVGDSDAIKELLTDRKDCYIVKHANAKDIAQSVKLLSGNKELRERIGQNGFTLFRKCLTLNHIGKEFISILRNER